MDKLGEVIFYDGHSEDILAIVGAQYRTFVQVATQSGLYAYSKYLIHYPDRYLMNTEGNAFTKVEPEFDENGYFIGYKNCSVTDEIVMFRLYDRAITK